MHIAERAGGVQQDQHGSQHERGTEKYGKNSPSVLVHTLTSEHPSAIEPRREL